MTPEELKYFLKYVGKQFWQEFIVVFKSVTNLARPKLWMLIFSIILLYQLGFVRQQFEVVMTLLMILFIWLWDYWEAGHWKGEMRKEFYERIKKKQERIDAEKKSNINNKNNL